MSVIASVRANGRPSLPWGFTVRNVQSPMIEVDLPTGRVWRMEGDHRWRMIICRSGEVWVTQERDLQDYVMTAGDVFVVTQPGLVLVQARENAEVQITPSLKSHPYVGKQIAFP